MGRRHGSGFDQRPLVADEVEAFLGIERVPQCFAEARQEWLEADGLCREQLSARRRLCTRLGEERYDPDFDPQAFEDNFARLAARNAYFPLSIGNR